MTKLYDIIRGWEESKGVAEVLTDPTTKALVYIIDNEEDWRRWKEKDWSSDLDRRKIAANLSKREGWDGIVRLRSYIGDPSNNQYYSVSEETKLVRTGFLGLRKKPKTTLRMQQAEGDVDFPWHEVDKFGTNMYVCRATVDDIVEEVKQRIEVYNKRDLPT